MALMLAVSGKAASTSAPKHISVSPRSATATKVYYISVIGSDYDNDGLSTDHPFQTIQRAADLVNPGDTVLIMDGVYTNTFPRMVVDILRSGSAAQWITFKNYPGHTPKIKFNSYGGILIGPTAAYIEINGLEIIGNNANVKLTDALNQPHTCKNPAGAYAIYGEGIVADGRKGTATQKPHHIRILNNTIHDCGGSGIGFEQTDYITIQNNVIYNNAWYSVYGTSGISLYQSWNSDNNTSRYKNIISGNVLHHNRNLVPNQPDANGKCEFTDGNGIIIDDNKNMQSSSPLGEYNGKTLIENNIAYNNGGVGIHVYLSQHVIVLNNTTYKNSQTPELNNGEIDASLSSDVSIINNILYADTNRAVSTNNQSTNVVYQNNLHFNGIMGQYACDSCISGNPNFVSESGHNFHLQRNSPAINAGNSSVFSSTDFDGILRHVGGAPDMGAYENPH